MIDRDSDRIRFVTRHFRELQGFRDRVPLGLLVLSLPASSYLSSKTEITLLQLLLFLSGMVLMPLARRYYERSFGAVEPLPLVPVTPDPALSIFRQEGSAAAATDLRIGRRSPFGWTQVPIGQHPAFGQAEVLIGWRAALTVAAAINGYLLLRAFSPSLDRVVDGSLFLQGERIVSPSLNLVFLAHTLYALCGAFSLVAWFARGRRLSQAYHLAFGLPLLALAVAGARLGALASAGDGTSPLARWVVPALVHLWVAVVLCGLSLIVTGLLDHLQLEGAFRHPARPREGV